MIIEENIIQEEQQQEVQEEQQVEVQEEQTNNETYLLMIIGGLLFSILITKERNY